MWRVFLNNHCKLVISMLSIASIHFALLLFLLAFFCLIDYLYIALFISHLNKKPLNIEINCGWMLMILWRVKWYILKYIVVAGYKSFFRTCLILRKRIYLRLEMHLLFFNFLLEVVTHTTLMGTAL